jgi:hypothetical protein
MAEHDSERAWDEYDWERFLQQQDKKTEKYMELLEKYIDHPQRDEIVAREMGWCHLRDGEEWRDEEPEPAFEEEGEEDTSLDFFSEGPESFEQHVLYRSAFALTVWIDQLFDAAPALQNDPAAVKLATHCALAAAKLAAALSDEEAEELGMTIAYLKRALKAITIALDAARQMGEQKALSRVQQSALHQRLFQVRDGIILLMGEFRGEWIRRHGSEGFRS